MTAQKITLAGKSYPASYYDYTTGRTVRGVGVTAGPFGATERTVTAARQATERQAQAFLDAYMQVGGVPIVACYGGWTSIVTLIPSCDDGAAWGTIDVDPEGVRSGQSSHDLTSRKQANARARFHLVQRVTDWHDDASVWAGADYLDALFAGHEEYGSASHLRYAAWQRAAKVTLESGVADWHEQASAQQAAHTVPARCDA